MLNRFWTVAAVAAVFTFCGFGAAQDKKGAGAAPPKLSSKMASENLKMPKASSLIKEASRGIDIGAPGADDVVKNEDGLVKMLEGLGLKPQVGGEGNDKFRYVFVNDVPMIFDTFNENNFVRFYTIPRKIKDAASIPSAKVFEVIANDSTVGGWQFNNQYQTFFSMFVVEAKITNKAVLAARLVSLAAMNNDSKAQLEAILVPSN